MCTHRLSGFTQPRIWGLQYNPSRLYKLCCRTQNKEGDSPIFLSAGSSTLSVRGSSGKHAEKAEALQLCSEESSPDSEEIRSHFTTGAVREQGCLTEKVDWEASLVPGYDGRHKYRKGCHVKEA